MKKATPIILLVLFISLLSTSNLSIVGENTNLTINSVTILQSSVNYGGSIDIQVDLTDADGINYVEATIYAPEQIAGNGPIYVTSMSLNFDPVSLVYTGSYSIGQYDPTILTVGEIYVQDNGGNGEWYGHQDLFDNYRVYFYSNYVNVTGTTPDYTPPNVTSFGYNASIFNAGETVRISVDASDDLSGISYVYVEIYRETFSSQYYYDDDFYKGIQLYYDPVYLEYIGHLNTYDYDKADEYYIAYIEVSDYEGNWKQYTINPDADNQIGRLAYTLVNDNYQPPISNLYFEYTTVDFIQSQLLYLQITNFGSGFNYGYIEFAYIHSEGYLNYIGFLSFDDIEYNSTSNFFEIDLASATIDYPPPQNVDIIVSYIYLQQVNGDSISFHNDEIEQHPFQVTGQFNDPFEVFIEPSMDMSYVGQQTSFDLIFKNNEHYNVEGAINVTVTPSDSSGSFIIDSDYLYFNSYDEITLITDYIFNSEDTYEITVYFTINGNETYSTTIQWNVVEIPEELIVEISPESGSSRIDQVARFNINITSTYQSDFIGLTVDFMAISQNGSHFETFNIDLFAFTSNNIQFDVIFDVAGIYEYNVTVTDGAEFWWSNTFVWEVIEENNNPPTNTDPENNDEPTNSSGGPEIQLPGFELYLSIIGFTSMLLITYQRRR